MDLLVEPDDLRAQPDEPRERNEQRREVLAVAAMRDGLVRVLKHLVPRGIGPIGKPVYQRENTLCTRSLRRTAINQTGEQAHGAPLGRVVGERVEQHHACNGIDLGRNDPAHRARGWRAEPSAESDAIRAAWAFVSARRIASLSAAAVCGQRAGMFTPPHRQRARAIRPAGVASVAGAAVWRRYPKRDGKGNIEWIHWADLELAAAWAEQALRDLDAFVVKYSGQTASAAQLEAGARAPIATEAFGVLRSLNNAFQALNVPPIVAPTSDELGTVDLIRSYVVLSKGRVEVRTQLMLGANRRGPAQAEEMAALWRTLGARELASDEGIVVDVRARRTAFRGPFEASLAFRRNAANSDRAFLALWARRPWTLVRAEDESELVWSAPLVWERDRVVRKLELARPLMQMIARDPWSALVSSRERVRENNAAVAIEWAGQLPELASTISVRQVDSIRESMQALAQARSEAALERARALAREGLATGAGSVVGVLGAISAAAPPAALVLAPAAAVLGVVAALAGLMLQVIPRAWLATAEVVPPRLPLPNMTTGYEGPNDGPSHDVAAPVGFARIRPREGSAPVPLDPPTIDALMTLSASAATARESSAARTPNRIGTSAIIRLLAPSSPTLPPPALDDSTLATPATTARESTVASRSLAQSPSSPTSSVGVVLASLGAAAALAWIASRD